MSPSPPVTLQFLGAGGAFSRRFGTTCSLLTLSTGGKWLIDCGRQAPDQLWAAGLSWHEIEGQIITHVHGDHVFGLEDFAFNRYYTTEGDMPAVMAGGPRPRFAAHSAVEAEVWETLAPSLRYLTGENGDPRSGKLESYFEVIRATEFEPPKHNAWRHSERFVAPGLDFRARETIHVRGKPSCSLEIRVGDPKGNEIAWWSGDSTVDPDWIEKNFDRTTIYFHDCTFTDYPGQVHGSFKLLAKLPEEVRTKMVLMHHEDDILEHQKLAEDLGFTLGLPGQVYDLTNGKRLQDAEPPPVPVPAASK